MPYQLVIYILQLAYWVETCLALNNIITLITKQKQRFYCDHDSLDERMCNTSYKPINGYNKATAAMGGNCAFAE